MYFIMLLCGISCEIAGCVHRPIVESRVQYSRLSPNRTLVSYTLAGLAKPAKLNFFKTPASDFVMSKTAEPYNWRTHSLSIRKR
jgi:hypothetical protein